MNKRIKRMRKQKRILAQIVHEHGKIRHSYLYYLLKYSFKNIKL